MKKILREPLLHFLVLGAGLFLVHGWLAGSGAFARDSLVISKGQVEHLASGFASLHQRPPMRHELDALIAEAIREEVFYREALAQGLDRDDVVVRRRMRQKLEFLAQDLDPVPEPTQAQLQEYLQQHPYKFQIEPRYSFRQVYLSPQRHGTRLDAQAARLLHDLKRTGDDAATRGDRLMLDYRYDAVDESEIRRLFGTGFATALASIPTGTWSGPVASGYGVHLVLIERRAAGGVASLPQVRDEVRREWKHAQQQAANARYYDTLRQRYSITVEQAEASKRGAAIAAELIP